MLARRINVVFDSLEKAGTFTKAQLDRFRQMMSGNADLGALFRGDRGGSALGPGMTWNARPGEGAVVGAAGARANRPAGEAAPGEPNPMDALNAFPGGMEAFTDLLKVPGQAAPRGGFALFGGGGGGGRGGQAPVVNTGDYLVTLTVGGKSYKQLLRVERHSGGEDNGSFFEEEHDKR